jgi:predicted ester cyclase
MTSAHDPRERQRVMELLTAAPHRDGAVDALFGREGRARCCHPVGDFEGAAEIAAGFYGPLVKAFPDIERRDHVFICGAFAGSYWYAATGNYFGTFAKPYLGIPATGRWAWLRYGEFHRMDDDGTVAESFILLDLPELMRQAGVSPLRKGLGIETLVPGPATGDGIRLDAAPDAETGETDELVSAMLERLFEPDRASMQMERFWADDMMWYGPTGIGTTRGLDGFFRDHTDPWVNGLPDWSDELASPRFSDGHYCGLVGWPSIRATQGGDLLGLPPTGRTAQIRVMDFWRRAGSRLCENWVLIDFPHMFDQLGVDVFAQMTELRDGKARNHR